MKVKMPKIEELIEAGVHYGHQVKRWNPKMEKYIYTASNKIHIIDLEKTQNELEKACEFLYETAKNGGKIIFVGTKKQARDSVELEANHCGAMFVNERWIGGTITNLTVIRKTLDKHLKMIKDRDEGKYLTTHTKKERLLIDREIEKFQKFYGGIASMKETPSAVFIIDQKRENTAIREAISSNIPVVGLIDTNADPTNIKYPIPGNDDAIRSIALIVKTLGSAVEDGYKEYEKNMKEAKAKREEIAVQAPVAKVAKSDASATAKPSSKLETKSETKAVVKTEKPAAKKTAVKKK
jgi:small subunit ribosomal protein S2